MKFWKAWAILFFSFEILTYSFFGLTGDILFFTSDNPNAFFVVTTIAGFLSVILFLFILCIPFLKRKFLNKPTVSIRLASTLIGVNVIYLFLNFVDDYFHLTIRGKYFLTSYVPHIYPEFFWWLLWMGLFYTIWRKIKKSRHSDIQERTEKLIPPVVSGILLIWFFLFLPKLPFFNKVETKDPKHLVLIVLDGWPAEHLEEMKIENPNKLNNSLFSDGRFFRNVRSNAIWTHGYFGMLYAGKGRDVFGFVKRKFIEKVLKPSRTKQPNFLEALQKNGVRTYGLYYHRTGLPEGSASRVSNYNGFRSIYLTTRHIPLLNLFNMDYFMIYPGPVRHLTHGNDLRGYMTSRLIPFLRPKFEYETILIDTFIPLLKQSAQNDNRSFILFHMGWANVGGADLPKLWLKQKADSKKGKIIQDIQKQDYEYKPDQTQYATKLYKEIRTRTKHFRSNFTRFLSKLKSQIDLNTTLVLITSDHGNMSSKGKVWYGFHAEEEVTRVPVFAIGNGVKMGTDDRLFATIDLGQTLLSYFGVKSKLNERAVSLLSNEKKKAIFSFTRPSHVRKEWFLMIYRDSFRYTFNIHSKGNGSCEKFRVKRYDTILLDSGPHLIKEVDKQLRLAFSEYALKSGIQVHPLFSSYQSSKI